MRKLATTRSQNTKEQNEEDDEADGDEDGEDEVDHPPGAVLPVCRASPEGAHEPAGESTKAKSEQEEDHGGATRGGGRGEDGGGGGQVLGLGVHHSGLRGDSHHIPVILGNRLKTNLLASVGVHSWVATSVLG